MTLTAFAWIMGLMAVPFVGPGVAVVAVIAVLGAVVFGVRRIRRGRR